MSAPTEQRGMDVAAEEQTRCEALVETAAPEAAELASAPAARPGLAVALRHKHFRTVWIASFGSSVGGWMELVGIQWIVAETTGDLTWMGYLAAAQLAPTLFLGLLGGVVADSVNRRTLLIITQAVMMAIAVCLALAAYFDFANPWVLLGLALAQGITTPFNAPAWQVLTPRLVPREDLTAAITLQGIQFNAARVVGPALGGALMSIPFFGKSGATTLFIINAIAFIGVMAAVLTTPDAPASPEQRGKWRDLRALWTRSADAMTYVRGHRGMLSVFIASSIFAILATPIIRFLPLFVSKVYHLEESAYGNMMAVMGAGAVVGGLLLGRIPTWYPKHHLIPVSLLCGAFSILAFSTTSNIYLAGFFMFFVGLFWMWTFNTCAAAMQLLVDDNRRGRVWAVFNTIALGLMPVGSLFAGYIGEGGAKILRHLRPEWWHNGIESQIGLGICGIILIGAGIIMLIWRTPEVDGLNPGDPGYDRAPSLWRGLTATIHRPRA